MEKSPLISSPGILYPKEEINYYIFEAFIFIIIAPVHAWYINVVIHNKNVIYMTKVTLV